MSKLKIDRKLLSVADLRRGVSVVSVSAPSDKQIAVLETAAAMVSEQGFQNPLVTGTADIQELSKTHEIVSRSKTVLWPRILTHYPRSTTWPSAPFLHSSLNRFCADITAPPWFHSFQADRPENSGPFTLLNRDAGGLIFCPRGPIGVSVAAAGCYRSEANAMDTLRHTAKSVTPGCTSGSAGAAACPGIGN